MSRHARSVPSDGRQRSDSCTQALFRSLPSPADAPRSPLKKSAPSFASGVNAPELLMTNPDDDEGAGELYHAKVTFQYPVEDQDKFTIETRAMVTIFPKIRFDFEISPWANANCVVCHTFDAALLAVDYKKTRLTWPSVSGNPITSIEVGKGGLSVDSDPFKSFAFPLLIVNVTGGTSAGHIWSAISAHPKISGVSRDQLRWFEGNSKEANEYKDYIALGTDSKEVYEALDGHRLKIEQDGFFYTEQIIPAASALKKPDVVSFRIFNVDTCENAVAAAQGVMKVCPDLKIRYSRRWRKKACRTPMPVVSCVAVGVTPRAMDQLKSYIDELDEDAKKQKKKTGHRRIVLANKPAPIRNTAKDE